MFVSYDVDTLVNIRFGDYANKVNDYLMIDPKKDDLLKIFPIDTISTIFASQELFISLIVLLYPGDGK